MADYKILDYIPVLETSTILTELNKYIKLQK